MISPHVHALYIIGVSAWLFVSYKKEDYVCVECKSDWCDKYMGDVRLKMKFWAVFFNIICVRGMNLR